MSSFLRARLNSFRFAFRGLGLLLRTQPNLWLHLLATGVVISAGIFVDLDAADWALIAFAIGLVWVAEALNTAVEFLGDAVSRETNALIGKAKDVAAAGVLLACLAAASVGLVIFLKYIDRRDHRSEARIMASAGAPLSLPRVDPPLPPPGQPLSLPEIERICRHYGLVELWQKIERNPPTHPFASDGCSGWVNEAGDISLYPACFLHDLKYWAGHPGEEIERLAADAELMLHVAALMKSTKMAEVMFHGVRVGGRESFRAPFSWGFGCR